MLPKLRQHSKHLLSFLVIALLFSQPAWAGGPPEPSIINNTLAVMLIIFMILLLIVIGILANILVGAAHIKLKSRKQENSTGGNAAALLLLGLFIPAGSLLAQDATTPVPVVPGTIGGISSPAFYLISIVIFLELAIIIVMLIFIRLLVKVEREKTILVTDAAALEATRNKISWWDKFNKLRPVSQEAELDLGHEYDGIRELNNRLPPWWIYGFYVTIVFAAVYLWRFHVTHNGPSSKEEYEIAVAKAELKIQQYLKAKGDAVDENTVTLLTGADDLAEGKAVFMKSCASCHTESGAGNVGPNLTDDYWMHGNDVKSIFKTIRYGINAMPQWQNSYSNKQIAQVTAYIKSLRGTNPPNAKAPQGIEMKEEPASNATDSTGKKDTKVAMANEVK
jgi:cytochrome c oxidase cbb3-type subunit 3